MKNGNTILNDASVSARDCGSKGNKNVTNIKAAELRAKYSSGLQSDRIAGVFNEAALTMKQAAEYTGIDRANICWEVAELREAGRIWPCGRALCPITKHRATFYSTNAEIFMAYVTLITTPIWSGLEAETTDLLNVAKEFALYGREDTSSLNEAALELWPEMKRVVCSILEGRV